MYSMHGSGPAPDSTLSPGDTSMADLDFFTGRAAWQQSLLAATLPHADANGNAHQQASIPLAFARHAARTGRIVLRREPDFDDIRDWSAMLAQATSLAAGLGALALHLLARAELASLPAPGQLARGLDAVLGRDDATAPRELAYWQARLEGRHSAAVSLEHLVGTTFPALRDSGYRGDPACPPADPQQPCFLARDAQGQAMLFAVGANHRLYLFQRGHDDTWQQADLSAALPSASGRFTGHVQSFDLRQDVNGDIAIALAVAPRRGDAASTVYAAGALSNRLDADGWRAALARLPRCPVLPDNAVVSQLTLAPLQAGGARLLLAQATVDGASLACHLDLARHGDAWQALHHPPDAAPASASASTSAPVPATPNPAAHSHAIGSYRRPGLWTLRLDGSLDFAAFPDQFGKPLQLAYADLPRHAASFLLAPGSVPNVPDVYVGGDSIVLYRGNHSAPELVAQVAGAQLVWSGRSAAAEHLAFVQSGAAAGATGATGATGAAGDAAMWLLSRGADGAWSAPCRLPGGRTPAALLVSPGTAGITALAFCASGALELLRFDGAGAPATIEPLPQRAVWEELPLTADELDAAIGGAAPVLYFASDEEYFPSDVGFFLRRTGLWRHDEQHQEGGWQLPPGTLWDEAAGDLAPAVLAVPGGPVSETPHGGYALKAGDQALPALLSGDPDAAPLYVHAKFLPADNATDLVFWMFCPHKGPALLKLGTLGLDRRVAMGQLGMHEGDWQRFVLRIDNDSRQVVKVSLPARDRGAWRAPSLNERDSGTGRLALYAARHSHAFFARAGDNLQPEHKTERYHIGLINHCDKGRRIDSWEAGKWQLVAAGFLGESAPAEPGWLQFPWCWGRKAGLSPDDVADAVRNTLRPAIGMLPNFDAVAGVVGTLLAQQKQLADGCCDEGPCAIKFRDGWFARE